MNRGPDEEDERKMGETGGHFWKWYHFRARDLPVVGLAYLVKRLFGGFTAQYLLKEVTVELKDGLRFTWGRDVLDNTFWMSRDYEIEVFNTVMGVFSNGGVFVDVGASAGLYAIKLGKTASHVYALEPNPRLFRALKRNIDLNNMGDKITPIQVAAWDSDAMLTITDFSRGGGSVDVKATVLDNTIPIPNPDLLKLDIEGAELRVLRGMERLRPRYILVEIHESSFGVDPLEVNRELASKGYTRVWSHPRSSETHALYERRM